MEGFASGNFGVNAAKASENVGHRHQKSFKMYASFKFGECWHIASYQGLAGDLLMTPAHDT